MKWTSRLVKMTDSIRLITDQAGSPAAAKLFINGEDVGVLYLTEKEFTTLRNVLTSGGEEEKIAIDVSQFKLEEEVDLDIFDEYD